MTDTDPTLIDLQRDHVLLGTDKRLLPVELTHAEWIELAEQAAALHQSNAERKAIETARRQAWTADHKVNENEHARLVKLVQDKAEERMVDVARYGIAESNEALTVRIDLGTTVGRRALSSAERELVLQPPLAFPNPNKIPDYNTGPERKPRHEPVDPEMPPADPDELEPLEGLEVDSDDDSPTDWIDPDDALGDDDLPPEAS